MRAAVGFSARADALEAAAEALAEVSRTLDHADLALVFASSHHAEDVQLIRDAILQGLRPRALLGGSTTGVISPRGEHEDQRGLGILAISGIQARTALLNDAALVRSFHQPDATLTLALPDPRQLDHDVLNALQLGPSLAGGAISGTGSGLFAMTERSHGEGLCAIAQLDRVAARVGVTQAAEPHTPFRPITRARRNVILEIDGRPAAALLREHVQAAGGDVEEQLPALLFAALRRPGDHGHVIRPIVDVDVEAEAIVLPDEPQEGLEVAFAWRETLAAVRDRQQMLAEITHELRQPVAALYFNCAGRGQSLHVDSDDDLHAIQRALPDVPLLGMTSSFELAPLAGRPRLLMYAGVLVVLHEPA